jgi:cell division protein ZapA (FtsZ GTPase activity inhibitor)
MASLKETVAERVAALGPAVQEGVVTVLVEQVKKKRETAILTALNLLEEKQKELKKIKPEQTFDAEGKVASEFFTKANNETRKKTSEAIAKIEKALEKALNVEKPEYDDLFKVVQNKGAASVTEEAPAE